MAGLMLVRDLLQESETVICRDDAMSDETTLNLSFCHNLKVL